MYDIEELSKMTKENLKKIAADLNIVKISALKKMDIANRIIEEQKKNEENKSGKRSVKKMPEIKSESKNVTKPEKNNEYITEQTKIEDINQHELDKLIDTANKKNAEKNLIEKETASNDTRNKNEFTPKKRVRPDDVVEMTGILDLKAEGYGFLRFENYSASKGDIYVSATQIRRFNLKQGDEITGDCRLLEGEEKSSPLLFVKKINGDPLEIALKRRPFEKLTPVFPIERLTLETDSEINSNRLTDLIAPIGKGQRGMIVAPPKAGKTTIIKSMAKAITKNNPECKLIILLIDERPEEVTDIKKSIENCDVVASTFDQLPENHCRLSEIVLERACRLVEQKKDVVILLDSITRLVRAYNIFEPASGRTLSGGLEASALHKPKKFFGAARKIENGGSLTIIATALVETGSRMDDVIFEEFKGTGNMELKLDRTLQERRMFPAIDILKSGTRREENLLSQEEISASWIIRRCLERDNIDSYSKILQLLKATKNNKEFINYINKNRSL